ncbi:uncharacterized protein LOC129756619 [Uranotaenia lowii]|uniref:uncharacterized protein LOC129756619 n=1 Tax=Uranotaenia lowii TaxID=190385 RepID=UPI0024783D89|nr:uncharacterized protein LOC129756619 [Uranotaenia lowii]
MQNLPYFDPRRPPPSQPFLTNFHYNSDLEFVERFLKHRTPTHLIQTPPKLSITDLKQTLSSLVKEIDHLKENKTILEQAIPFLPDSEWKKAVEEQTQVVASINDKITRLKDPNLSGDLQRKIKARLRKRRWQKKRNAQLKKEKLSQLENRKKLHKKIDSWQCEQQKLLAEQRKSQQELEQASHVLADVHKRKAACKRNLAKFEKLKIARQLRQEYNRQEPNQDPIFSELIKLTETWAAKLADCIKEEKQLKDTLARQSAANAQRRTENEWNRVLFGDTIPRKFDHPLLKADRSREALIETRRAWDACLVHDDVDGKVSSSIPLGWVLPPSDPSVDWAKYLWTKMC